MTTHFRTLAATLTGLILVASTPALAQSADVSVVVDTDAQVAEPGEMVTFRITVDNAGPDATSELGVQNTLPAGVTLVSATPSFGDYFDGDGIWFLFDLPSAATATLDLVVELTDVDDGDFLTHTAEVLYADWPDPDSIPGNADTTEDDWGQTSVIVQDVDDPAPPTNRAPEADNLSYEVDEPAGTTISIYLDAWDEDADPLTYRVLNGDAKWVGPEPNHFEYKLVESWSNFEYVANDGQTDSNVASVSVTNAHQATMVCSVSALPRASRSGTAGTLTLLALALLLTRRRRG